MIRFVPTINRTTAVAIAPRMWAACHVCLLSIKESPTVVAGDFNDNVKWDRPTKRNNHGTWHNVTLKGPRWPKRLP
jgi:hypothetical protein